MSTPGSHASAELLEARGLAEKRDWVALAARFRASPGPALVAEPELGFLYADACRRTGDTATALAVGEQVDVAARRGGNRSLVVNVVNLLGMALFEAGRMAEAEARFGELLEHADNWGDRDFAARAANGLGAVANVRGRRDLALIQYQHAIAGYAKVGNRRGLAQTHYNLGLSFRDLGFDSDADAHYRRAIEFATATASDDVIALAETERAFLRARAGDGALAHTLAMRAVERFERIGDPTGAAQAMRVLAAAARAGRDDAEAERQLARALEIARRHDDLVLLADVQRDRGLLLRDLGRVDEAHAALLEAAEHFDGLGSSAEAEAMRMIASSVRSES